jgi:membrane protein required for colicin V production
MNWADWVIIGILLVSCLFGLIRGFVREALSLTFLVAAALCARIFVGSIEPFLITFIDTPSIRTLTAFLIIFILVLLFGALVQYLFGALIKASGLSLIDRTLGFAFGVVRGLIIVMLLILLSLNLTQVKQDPWWNQSQLIPFFMRWSDDAMSLYSHIGDWFIQMFGVTPKHSI